MDSSTPVPDLRLLPPDHALQRDDWSKRRLRLDLIVLLFSGLLSYIVLSGQSTVADQLIVPSLIAGIVSLVATYVFGAVWDYRSFMVGISNFSNNQTTSGSEKY